MSKTTKVKMEIKKKDNRTLQLSVKVSHDEQPDIEAMTIDQLKACLARLQEQLDALDRKEPEAGDTDACEEWADQHEELEDLIDEVQDRLEELSE